MVWQGIQRSSQWENETTRYAVSYCWQTSFIIWTHLSPTGEHTCFAGTATVLSIEAHTGTPPAADWKRPPGRPRRNWLQQVEEDIGLSVGAARIAGQYRSMWRTLWSSAGQAQQWVSEWRCYTVLCWIWQIFLTERLCRCGNDHVVSSNLDKTITNHVSELLWKLESDLNWKNRFIEVDKREWFHHTLAEVRARRSGLKRLLPQPSFITCRTTNRLTSTPRTGHKT